MLFGMKTEELQPCCGECRTRLRMCVRRSVGEWRYSEPCGYESGEIFAKAEKPFISGATTSPAAYAVMTRSAIPGHCPWCRTWVVPSAMHVAWECEGVSPARQRLLGPGWGDITEGWPTGHRLDGAVLQCLIEVRDLHS